MIDVILTKESLIRLTVFFGLFILLATLEVIIPKRQRRLKRSQRWFSNLGIVVISTVVVRIFATCTGFMLPVGLALLAEQEGIGLLNIIKPPLWFNIIFSVMLLDLIVYSNHRLFHSVPGLWRLHMVHHADMDLDVTSGSRFHPLEILISIFVKSLAILIIGPAAVAVMIFEVILNGMAQFNHANINLGKFDGVLRLLLVTPDMHITHHSTTIKETNSNFGFNLSLWDRLFKTYRQAPDAGYENIEIGLKEFRNPKETYLPHILLTPFSRKYQPPKID